MGEHLERYWPVVGALAAAGLWWRIGLSSFPAGPDALLGTAATVASIFASFLGVSKAILLTVKDTAVYQALAKHGLMTRLFDFVRTGVNASIAFAVLSILGFFLNPMDEIAKMRVIDIFASLWVFCGCLAVFSYIRVSNILFKLLRQA